MNKKILILCALVLAFGYSLTGQNTEDLPKLVKNTHLYMVTYVNENGSHIRPPRKVYRTANESLSDVKAKVAASEKGNKYKFSTFNYLSEQYPYGLLYYYFKNGIKKYALGEYTTIDYAKKMWREKENLGYTCVEIISLN